MRSIDESIAASMAVASASVPKTIILGAYKDNATYYAAFNSDSRYVLGTCGAQLIAKMPIASSTTTVNLAFITVRELGFPEGATRYQIFAVAAARGLQKCPAEVGPAIRLAYADQPYMNWILIGMDPVHVPDGDPNVFTMGHDDIGRWLDAGRADPACHHSPDGVWVFLASK